MVFISKSAPIYIKCETSLLRCKGTLSNHFHEDRLENVSPVAQKPKSVPYMYMGLYLNLIRF